MAYFDSAKNRAMWNRELAELRQEKERRAREGYKPGKSQEMLAAEKAVKAEDPRRRRIDLAELERIEARSGKIRKIKRPTREHAYVKGKHYPDYDAQPRKQL